MSTTVQHGELLTVAETAQRLTLSEKTVRRLIDADLLPALRVGRRAIRVDAGELEDWLYADHNLSRSTIGSPAPDPAATAASSPRGSGHGNEAA